MSRSEQTTELKFVVTNTLIVADIERSVAFYRDVLGATVLRQGEPTFLRLAMSGSLSTAVAVRPTTNLKLWLRRRAIQMFLASFSTFA